MKKIRTLILFLLISQLGLGQDTVRTVESWYETSDIMKIPKKTLKTLSKDYNFIFLVDETPKNLKRKGFYSMDNNPSDYFVSYFYNNTDKKIEVPISDGSLIAIQEALNRDGLWQPIEHWSFSWCGNSYSHLMLNKKEFILVPIKKYSGNYKTLIRLKIQSINGEKFYSKPFESYINESQFNSSNFNFENYIKNSAFNYLD